MYIIFYNTYAILLMFVGILGGGLACLIFPTGDQDVTRYAPMICCGITACFADLGLRYYNSDEQSGFRILDPRAGGQLWFVPIWILVLLVIGLGVGNVLANTSPSVKELRSSAQTTETGTPTK